MTKGSRDAVFIPLLSALTCHDATRSHSVATPQTHPTVSGVGPQHALLNMHDVAPGIRQRQRVAVGAAAAGAEVRLQISGRRCCAGAMNADIRRRLRRRYDVHPAPRWLEGCLDINSCDKCEARRSQGAGFSRCVGSCLT